MKAIPLNGLVFKIKALPASKTPVKTVFTLELELLRRLLVLNTDVLLLLL